MLQSAISFPVDVNRGGSPSFYDSIPFNALFMVALSYRILIYFHLPFTTRPSVGCFSFSSHCPIGRSECMPKREWHVTRYVPIGQGWGYWQHEVSPSAMGQQSPGRKSHLSPLSLSHTDTCHPTGSSGYSLPTFASTPHSHHCLHNPPGQSGTTAEPVMRLKSIISLKGGVQGITCDIIACLIFVKWLAT